MSEENNEPKFTDTQILNSLSSSICLGCKGIKKTRRSFCAKCYWRISPDIRAELYRPFNDGYQEAFHKAAAALNIPADRVEIFGVKDYEDRPGCPSTWADGEPDE